MKRFANSSLRGERPLGRKIFDWRRNSKGRPEYVQKGFGRTEWAIELLKGAIEIRNDHPEASRGKLAGTLQELAIHQIRQCEYDAAEANLTKAGTLLEEEIVLDSAREENKAGLAQVLVLRSRIAGALAQKQRAIASAEAARNIQFQDRVLQAENEILVAAALSSVLELTGDISAAIAEQNKVLDVYLKSEDLLTNGFLDQNGIADTLSWLGSLYLKQNELTWRARRLPARDSNWVTPARFCLGWRSWSARAEKQMPRCKIIARPCGCGKKAPPKCPWYLGPTGCSSQTLRMRVSAAKRATMFRWVRPSFWFRARSFQPRFG